nr:hypothetical protein HmN_000754200 [Hymenolepis microstoma]
MTVGNALLDEFGSCLAFSRFSMPFWQVHLAVKFSICSVGVTCPSLTHTTLHPQIAQAVMSKLRFFGVSQVHAQHIQLRIIKLWNTKVSPKHGFAISTLGYLLDAHLYEGYRRSEHVSNGNGAFCYESSTNGAYFEEE